MRGWASQRARRVGWAHLKRASEMILGTRTLPSGRFGAEAERDQWPTLASACCRHLCRREPGDVAQGGLASAGRVNSQLQPERTETIAPRRERLN